MRTIRCLGQLLLELVADWRCLQHNAKEVNLFENKKVKGIWQAVGIFESTLALVVDV